MNPHQDLNRKLEKIKKVFEIQSILNLKPDKDYIRSYYKANKLAYSLFHTFSDNIHMGISRNGKYKESDLYEAERFIEKYIKQLNAKNVFELGTGKGAASSYLAARHKDVEFEGIDITEEQLESAYKKAKKLKNYHPVKGDYHNLGGYKDGAFDVVFVIEALCHSSKKEKVLGGVHRVLKPGGVFIIFDGYLRKKRKKLTKEELTVARLTEKTMAVSEFENYDNFKKKINKSKFTVDYEEDVSKYITPTLKKFERLARIFFNHPKLAKIIIKLFPKEFTYNAVAGYLLPNMISMGTGCYYITILRKKD